MLQKVIQVGNSYAVIIPKKLLESVKIQNGDFAHVSEGQKRGRIIVDLAREEEVAKGVIDPEVYRVAKQLLRRYLPAFKELANK
jgi:putative addiction module antidote